MNRAKMMMRFEPHMEKNIFKLFIYDTVTKKGTFDWSTWETVDSKTSAQYFADQLSQIPDNAEIELYINSNGGSVSEGVAIYNQLKRHPAQKTGYVDGIAYSVASLILQACDKRIMGLGTSMLVHEMWVEVAGNARMLRSAADDLDNWMKANRKVYMERSGMSEEELIALMEEERILTPEMNTLTASVIPAFRQILRILLLNVGSLTASLGKFVSSSFTIGFNGTVA